MTMLKHALHDFMATVPSCVQTTCLSEVLEIFQLGQCDRLMVVSEQQSPIGVIYPARLMPQLMSSHRSCGSLDEKQPLSGLGVALVEPIATLPAELSVEQFELYLRSQQLQTNTGFDWALVDSTGKFLGLLDSVRLLQFLALSPPAAIGTDERVRVEPSQSLGKRFERPTLDSLVQLLERLPWPMTLQTGAGEVVTQNPAWLQQFGALSDPEVVRREVEAILKTRFAAQAEIQSQVASEFQTQGEVRINASCPTEMLGANVVQTSSCPGHLSEAELNHASIYAASCTPYVITSPLPLGQADAPPPEGLAATPTSPAKTGGSSSSHCQLGIQPGTCICTWLMQNGQERVWQFVKLPLVESGVRGSQLRAGVPSLSRTDRRVPEFSQTGVQGAGDLGRHAGVISTDLWLLLATDVTEQQQLASELVAKNADLIQLNRLKDEFLACISHELKTPLTAVLGLSTLLKNQALGQLNERQARYAGLIHESGRHLMTVVNDILDLTRMETGQMELTPEPVQIATVVRRAIEQARAIQSKTSQSCPAVEPHSISLGDHRFTLLIEPGLDSIVADELRLRQMLVHLLSNAFKFTEAGGEIGLRVSRWEGWIAFTVWDTGIGIPEHQQHLIFQKFQQLENPLSRRFEGTGLGLVLTRALARLHGGDVSFLSKEGKGSEFTLLLPPSPPKAGFADGEVESRGTLEQGSRGAGGKSKAIFSSPEPPLCPSAPPPPTSSKRLVLVVEAAPRFIEDLTEQLTNLGCRVVIARSGTEALEKARRLQPKAIFLNPLLPLLSGWDVLTLLKSDAATRQIPAIVTATRAQKDQAFSNRADEFLSLPVQQQVLQQVMARFCAIPPISQFGKGVFQSAGTDTSMTILCLTQESGVILDSGFWLLNSELLHQHHHRVLEADDLEQAEILARIWQPDVILLAQAIPDPLAYLKQLTQYPSLAALPLVTLDAATTQAANQVTGLSVFHCLTPAEKLDTDALLSILQIAARRSWKPSVLMVDVATLPDLQEVPHSSHSLRSEWFQALIQYLQTAGLRAVMGRSWAEVLQQIQQQSVDLLLIYLGDEELHPGVLAALTALNQQHNVPPVLVLEQRLSQGELSEQFRHDKEENGEESILTPREATAGIGAVQSLETVLGAIATQILPPSVSMAELLDQIHQTLALSRGQGSSKEI